MKVRALKREKIMKSKAEILTPAEVEVSIWTVIKNDISSFNYVYYESSAGFSAKRNEIALGKLSYIDDSGKKTTLKRCAVLFEKLSDFITFLSTRYIPEGKYPIDEFVSDIKRKVKQEKRRKKEIQDEIIDALYSLSSRYESKSSFGPFYIRKGGEFSLSDKNITLIGWEEDSLFVEEHSITLTELPPFRNISFLKAKEDETSLILKKYTLDIKGKQVPYSKFLIKPSRSEGNILLWDGNTFRLGFIDYSGEFVDPLFDEKVNEMDSGGEIYSSSFFEYLPIPQAEVKFVVRIPSWDEVKKLRIDTNKVIQKPPSVKDTVYMIDTLSAIRPEKLSSAKVVIDDPEDALRIWSRTYSKIFVPDDAPSSEISLPKDELYLAGVVI